MEDEILLPEEATDGVPAEEISAEEIPAEEISEGTHTSPARN